MNELTELIGKLWKSKAFIIKWVMCGAVVGLVIAFSLPKTYKSGAVLAPEAQQRTNSSISSIASMMGVNLNNSVDAISVEMFPDVLHSTPFIVDLLEKEVTFERKGNMITAPLLDYMLEYQKDPWWSHIFAAPFKVLGWALSLGKEDTEVQDGPIDPTHLTRDQKKVVKFFSENIQVLVDKKTDKTSISLILQDPAVVYDVMGQIVENLKTYMSDYRTSKARQDVENLSMICDQRKAEYYAAMERYAENLDANHSVIRKRALVEQERLQQEMNLAYQVYSQVATQLEGARIQEEQAKPVFVVIEPVAMPNRKYAPSKAKMLVLFAFMAGCLAMAWVLWGKDFWKDMKDSL